MIDKMFRILTGKKIGAIVNRGIILTTHNPFEPNWHANHFFQIDFALATSRELVHSSVVASSKI